MRSIFLLTAFAMLTGCGKTTTPSTSRTQDDAPQPAAAHDSSAPAEGDHALDAQLETPPVQITPVALKKAASGGDENWGTLLGRLVLSGDPPELTPIKPTKDQFCIQQNPPNESVIVGEQGGLANVVIYVRPKKGKPLDVHPDYEAQMEETVELDNKACQFVPHVTLVRTGQPFVIKNSDPTGHNTNASLRKNGDFNVIIAAGSSQPVELTKAETLPMPVQCNIHPFMKGYLLVREDPYMAVSGEDGSFEILNLPTGEHEFQFWHESVGYLKNVKFDGGALSKKGRAKLEIAGGEMLDLGLLEVPARLMRN